MIGHQTDDDGVVSQPEYTVTKPSNGPNGRDHLSAPVHSRELDMVKTQTATTASDAGIG